MIILKNEKRYVYSVPSDRSPEVMMNDVIMSDRIDRNEIKSNYFFPNTLYSIHDYLYYFNEDTKKVDDVLLAIDFKIEEVKKHRQSFFSVLDFEFMKSLEEGSKSWTEHITKIKNYLRDLPPEIEPYCKNMPVDQIVKFNGFNNIFDIHIINGGSGYTKPPKVIIEDPNGLDMSGFKLKAVATIKDGKVVEITVTQVGSGYDRAPSINISPPDGEGSVAVAAAALPENDIHSIKQK